MRFLINSVYELVSIGFYSVLETQWVAGSGGLVGIGVCNWLSSFEMTLSGSYGIRLVPAKPPYMFFSVIEIKNTSRNM
jgi:hypothetical protein